MSHIMGLYVQVDVDVKFVKKKCEISIDRSQRQESFLINFFSIFLLTRLSNRKEKKNK